MPKPDRVIGWGSALFCCLVLALGLSWQIYQNVDRPFVTNRVELHQKIVAGSAESPYRYRVLVPYAVDPCIRLLSTRVAATRSFLVSYMLYDMVAFTVALLGCLYLLSLLYGPVESLVGVFLFCATLPVSLQNQWFQPWSLLEPGLFAFALAFAFRGRWLAFAVLTMIAALNRETAIFIPLAALFGAPRAWRKIVPALLLAIVIPLALRLALGSAPVVITPAQAWNWNRRPVNLALAIWNGTLLLGPWLFLSWRGYLRAPKFFQNATRVVPVYLGPVAILGVWYEVRVLTPLLPLLLPLVVASLFNPGVRPAES